jgi:acyl phosphate:glycerol-3-phosphate acyltransferase
MEFLCGSIAVLVLAYLAGSVPWGFLIGKAKGMDIRHHGSGNIGATNVRRVLGKPWGVTCFVLDFLKGLLPVVLIGALLGPQWGLSADAGRMLAAAGAVCGHVWPVWLGFRGGKGVATTIGALLAVSWLAVLLAVVTWLVVFWLTRYVSAASLAAAVMLPLGHVISGLLRHHAIWTPALGILLLLAALIIFRHRGNIQRLRNGTEYRFGSAQ